MDIKKEIKNIEEILDREGIKESPITFEIYTKLRTLDLLSEISRTLNGMAWMGKKR